MTIITSILAIFIMLSIIIIQPWLGLRKYASGINGTDYIIGKRKNKLRPESFLDKYEKKIIIVIIEIYFALGICIMKYSISTVWADTGKYIDGIPGLLLTTYVCLIALLSIVFGINKDRYVLFSIQELIEKYHLKQKLVSMLHEVLIAYVCLYLGVLLKGAPKNDLYFFMKLIVAICLINFLYYFSNIIHIILDFVLDFNIEKRCLDLLYQEFWYTDVEHDHILINQSSVKNSMNYLITNYIAQSRKVKLDKVMQVKYNYLFAEDEEIDTLRKKLLIRSNIKAFSFFTALFWLTSIMELGIGQNLSTETNVTLYLCVVLFAFIFGLTSKSYRDGIISMVYHINGYFIVFQPKKKLKYYADFQILDKRATWSKYFIELKNIIRLYYLVAKNDKDGCNQTNQKEDTKNGIQLWEELYQHCAKITKEHKEEAEYESLLFMMSMLDYYNYILFGSTNWFEGKESQLSEKMESMIQAVVTDIVGECDKKGEFYNQEYKEFISLYRG